jgi:hypothetical protein
MANETPETQPPKPKRAKRQAKLAKSLKVGMVEHGEDVSTTLGPEDLIRGVRRNIGSDEKDQVLKKSVSPQKVPKDVESKYGRTKIVFGSRYNKASTDNIETKGYQRLADSELRQLSQVDPYISAIIATRVGQGAACGTLSESKFKKGMRVNDLDPLDQDAFASDEEYEQASEAREEQLSRIEQWVLNCGTTDQAVLNYTFNGLERTFKYCSLRQFLEAQIRNLMTFGRCATQILRNDDGLPVIFRPVPVETIAPVIDGENTGLARRKETADESVEDLMDYNALPYEERPKAWVQRIDGQDANFFTEDDLHVWDYQKQALFDLNGYPLSPIEQAVFMVFVHQQTLSYLRNQFVKGMATKGVIVLKSTNENIQISDADIEDFKQQFHNFVTRTDNSAVTPVIGGPVELQWQPLSQSPKDMEFLQVEEHIIRALCSAFQISPQEMGYGHLSLPQGGLSQANKQEEIIKGEERGLRNLLDIIFEGINEIMFENFPEARKKFKISYVGVGEDTRDAVVARNQQELNTTATMQSLWSDSEKSEQLTLGATMPLAPAYHSNVLRYCFFWEIREKFFGEERAKENPAYWFIVDSNLNQAYQQLKVQPVKLQQEQAQIGLEQGKQQLEMGQAQMQQAAQQPAPGQAPAPAEGQPAPEGEQQEPQEGGGQPMKQSLRDRYKAGHVLQKSHEARLSSYFKEWVRVHRPGALN